MLIECILQDPPDVHVIPDASGRKIILHSPISTRCAIDTRCYWMKSLFKAQKETMFISAVYAGSSASDSALSVFFIPLASAFRNSGIPAVCAL